MQTYPNTVEALENRTLLSGNVVTEWNNVAINAIRQDQTDPGPGWASRNMAIMHAAVFDAVNSIAHAYTPYLVNLNAPSWASKDAAAAMAADVALSAIYPAQKPTFAAILRNDLSQIRNGISKMVGEMVGYFVGNQVVQSRANDGASATVPYTPGTAPGQYQPTPPDYTPAWGPGWGKVKPFAIPSADQFQAPPPPALTSADYAAAYNQVKALGSANSTTRTADQTQIADFWSYDTQAYGTPIVHYNQILQNIAQQQGNTMVQDARLFALANIAMADAGIACWNSKFTYNLWRPVTGIQNGNLDGNAATTADPNWLPLGAPDQSGPRFTPPFPSYTSGHAAFGQALFTTLANVYGTDNIAFTATSDVLPSVTRSYTSFSQAADENAHSRVYMGVHWIYDCNAAQAQGKAIGNYVTSNILQPLDSSGDSTTVAQSTGTTMATVMPRHSLFSSTPIKTSTDTTSSVLA